MGKLNRKSLMLLLKVISQYRNLYAYRTSIGWDHQGPIQGHKIQFRCGAGRNSGVINSDLMRAGLVYCEGDKSSLIKTFNDGDIINREPRHLNF